jgi:hypothetical protein
MHERTKTPVGMPAVQIGGRALRKVEQDESILTLQDGMLYSRLARYYAGTDVLEHAFDGSNYFIGRPPLSSIAHQPSLTKIDVRWLVARDPKAPWVSAVYLELAGFSIPSTSAELSRREAVQSRILKLVAAGARFISCRDVTAGASRVARVEIEVSDPDGVPPEGLDRSRTQLRWQSEGLSKRQIEEGLEAMKRRFAPPAKKRLIFHLDPQRNFAVARYEERKASGAVLFSAINDDFYQLPGRDLWLPRSCRVTHYTGEHTLFTEPVLESTVRVRSIEVSRQSEGIFTLNYSSPGTKIHEQLADGSRESYEIAAKPADLFQAISRARDSRILTKPSNSTRYWWSFLVVGASLTLAAIVLTVQSQRLLRRPQGQP